MSVEQMGLVWKHQFDHAEQAVMLALADHAHDDGTEIRPGVARIAWKTGYSERQVQRILTKLRDDMEILVMTRKGDGRGNPNVYRIDWTKGVKKAPFTPKKKGDIEAVKGDISEKKGDIAASPEPSTENHPSEPSCSRRDADASPEEKKTNWFTVLCERFKEVGIPISPEDRERLPGNLVSCVMKEGATAQEMHRVVGRIVSKRLDKVTISPQRALGDVRGNPGKPSHFVDESFRPKKRVL